MRASPARLVLRRCAYEEVVEAAASAAAGAGEGAASLGAAAGVIETRVP
jgi:hypothetical protein